MNSLTTMSDKFSTMQEKIIFIGTYNLNGKLPRESLDLWLTSNVDIHADLVMIGVQELIELTPGQYISADTDKLRLVWESAIVSSLNRSSSQQFVLLRSTHLVALGMFAFAKTSEAAFIRGIEVCCVKTGLMGMAANKGGIGISLKYHDSSLAFITAHFAAGHDAIQDRNKDYWTISSGMVFRGRNLANHDLAFWFGDFNYRIEGGNQLVRGAIASGQLGLLYANDQVSNYLCR